MTPIADLIAQGSAHVWLLVPSTIWLAVTMVSIGAAAAIGAQQALRRWTGFGNLMSKAPHASRALIIVVGLDAGVSAIMQLVACKLAVPC